MAIGRKPSSLARPMISFAELAGAGRQDERLFVLVAHDVEHGERGQRVDDHRGAVLVAHAVDQRYRRAGLGDRVVSPRAPVAGAGREGDALADKRLRGRIGSGGGHDADALEAGRLAFLARLAVETLDERQIGGVDRGQADLDQQLRRPRLRHRDGAQLDIGLHRLDRDAGRLARIAVALEQQALHFARYRHLIAPLLVGQGLRMILPADPRPSTLFSTAAASASG